jgi:hypothetical protein
MWNIVASVAAPLIAGALMGDKENTQSTTATLSPELQKVQNKSSENMLGLQSSLSQWQNPALNNYFSNLFSGELPLSQKYSLKSAFENIYGDKMGNVLNSMGNRGIMNSTASNKAIGDMNSDFMNRLNESYFNQYNNNMNNYRNAVGLFPQIYGMGLNPGSPSSTTTTTQNNGGGNPFYQQAGAGLIDMFKQKQQGNIGSAWSSQ